MRNRASSLWNNGYVGGNDHVNFYYSPSYGGAWDCLSPGTSWSNLVNQWFAYGQGLPGYGQSTNDNIASHKWVDYCGLP
jgi:peptidase inhibitor family I36